MAGPLAAFDVWFDELRQSLERIEGKIDNQGRMIMAVNEDIQGVTDQLGKVLTEVTSVNDDLKARIAELEASQADPAVIDALKAASQRLDDLNADQSPEESPVEEPPVEEPPAESTP